ncbi:TetR/AcrR family transcriptional regulator [Symbioplanes lichenis]|uniref:TetR/AcrR family transcriptional regulator n=1 Tax=Symbioplanes lichenis TaxID=1629072 RepID=UPI002739CBE8|nr:TetR family transcriptional regulator C-terminal domain-containing protein [Actinoplanes lichenis]
MPRRTDHQERRALIADALMRVAAERGLEEVSLRHIAAEAGVSLGMVQHYFRTKAEMMLFAMTAVRERGEARVGAAVAALGDNPAPRDLLRTIITAVLPLSDQARADGKVALAFLAYSAVRPEAAAALHLDTAQLLSHVASMIPTERPDQDAAALLAIMEGLGVYLLGGHYSPDQALAALDAYLDKIYSGTIPKVAP